MRVRYNTGVARQPSINSIRTKRDEYLDDMAKILMHMKRFQSAVEKARIEWGIPGGLPTEKRAAWYQSFFIKPDIDVDNTKYANSQSELLPPSKMIRTTLQKFSDEFNLDVRWHNSLFNHIAGDNVPLRAPSGLPYVEIRLNDSRLPKEEWIVKRMWIELYADTSQEDFTAVWRQVKQYQSMMATKFPKKRRARDEESINKYIKIRELEDKGITQKEIVDEYFKNDFPSSCGASIVAEDKHRKRKVGDPVYHVYYHCSRQKKYDCVEQYITEEKLIKQILRYINFMQMAHPQLFTLNSFLKNSMESYKKTRDEILWAQNVNPINKPLELMDYASYIFRNGTLQEKREITNVLNRQLYIHNETVTSLPLI